MTNVIPDRKNVASNETNNLLITYTAGVCYLTGCVFPTSDETSSVNETTSDKSPSPAHLKFISSECCYYLDEGKIK